MYAIGIVSCCSGLKIWLVEYELTGVNSCSHTKGLGHEKEVNPTFCKNLACFPCACIIYGETRLSFAGLTWLKCYPVLVREQEEGISMFESLFFFGSATTCIH